MVNSTQLHITYAALHTIRMIVGVVVNHAVSNNLLFTNGALFSSICVTFPTEGFVILGEEFTIQLLVAGVTLETIFMENLSKCCTAILC